MIAEVMLEQDLALKKAVQTPEAEKPHFDWAEIVMDRAIPVPAVTVVEKGEKISLDLGKVAETIGSSLTDLLVSRGNEDIFTGENKDWVARLTIAVADNLVALVGAGQPLQITLHDLHVLIEKTLVENDAFDVARSLILHRGRFRREDLQKDLGEVRLIRRNGQVVPWTASKIEIAVRKSFLALQLDSSPAVDVARAVTERVADFRQAFVHIEEVQDMVQEELMKGGHYKVAESYIIYRAHRAMQRRQAAETAPIEPQQEMIVVKKGDGQTEFWDGADLKLRIRFATIGLDLCMTEEEIEAELRRAVFNEISESELRNTIVLNAKTLIEKDADFARFAARILLTYIYEEVLDWSILKDGIGNLKIAHQKYLKKYLKRGIEIDRLNPKLLDYDLDTLSAAIDPSADLDFDYLGIQTLYDRYLIIDKHVSPARRLEVPQIFWMRVSMGLMLNENAVPEERVIQLYEMYKSRRFCSSTPTLFNAGTAHSQLSSCYLYYVDDSIEGIMQRGIAENAYLSKWAGGLGGSWTSVRGTGSYISGTNGESQGVIPFLKLHNDLLVAVNQGGKRRGSGCAYLETWHNDLFDFLELRRNTGDDRRRCHDMNTANWIPDLFMKRMEAREDWTFFRSSEVPDLHHLYGSAFEEKYVEYEKLAEEGKLFGRKLPAIEVWKKMLAMLFETGHPWITFKDPCNVRSPQDHAGVIHSSNLCTEITLNTSNDETAVCNLGSVVLDNHLKEDGSIDHERLRDTIRVAVRALDNVIDLNYYPTEAAQRSNLSHRPIGLGVMGLHNALYRRDVPFASEEAVEFNDEIMEAVAYYAYEASSDIASERGTYPTYRGSKWDRGLLPQDTLELLESERGVPVEVPRGGKMDWTPIREKIRKQGMRNSNVIAIAPTATISNIVGTTPCIEPTYKNIFVKSNLSGEFIVLNSFLVRDLKERDLWNQEMIDNLKYFDGELTHIDSVPEDLKAKYQTAFAVPFEFIVNAAARRQKWIDQSQSVNLFLGEPDMKTMSHMYRLAWRAGLKTTYYLRTLGASNIEKATVSMKKELKGVVAGTNGEVADTPLTPPADRPDIDDIECEACQ